MIVRKALTVTNNRYAASVGVEFSSLEMQYAKAYGEPIIELNGVITYVPSTNVPPADQIPLDADVGLGGGAGSAAENETVSGLTVAGSGNWDTSPVNALAGFFHGASDVIGDFQFTVDLLSIYGVEADTTNGGYRIGIAILKVLDPSAEGFVFGVGSNNAGAFDLSVLVNSAQGASYAVAEDAAISQPITGIKLRVTRVSNDLTLEYSTDGGESFEELAVLEISGAAWNVGLLVGSGSGSAATAVFNKISLTHAAQGPGSQFTIGGEKRVLMRSQAPHQFGLDKNLDPEAQAKVTGWANTIETRLRAAMTTLLQNENPNDADTEVVTQ